MISWAFSRIFAYSLYMHNAFTHGTLSLCISVCIGVCVLINIFTYCTMITLMPVYFRDLFIMQSGEQKNKITYWKCHQPPGMEVKEIHQSSRLPWRQAESRTALFKSMKLTKAIECGREEMSGTKQHMWDLQTVNNLERDINGSAAGDYLTLRAAVKHGSTCLGARKCQAFKDSALVMWKSTGAICPKYYTY